MRDRYRCKKLEFSWRHALNELHEMAGTLALLQFHFKYNLDKLQNFRFPHTHPCHTTCAPCFSSWKIALGFLHRTNENGKISCMKSILEYLAGSVCSSKLVYLWCVCVCTHLKICLHFRGIAQNFAIRINERFCYWRRWWVVTLQQLMHFNTVRIRKPKEMNAEKRAKYF